MQRNDTTRRALLPPGEPTRYATMQNEDILHQHLGLENDAVQALNERAAAAGKDSLVLYCEEQGLDNLHDLLT